MRICGGGCTWWVRARRRWWPSDLPAVPPRRESAPAEPVVGFVGAMDYGPNVDGACWFAETVWPRIVEQRSGCELVARRTIARAGGAAAGQRDEHPGDRHRAGGGAVSGEDAGLHCPAADRAGRADQGLMAMTAGRPCVVTPGVAEGLGARPGRISWWASRRPSSPRPC